MDRHNPTLFPQAEARDGQKRAAGPFAAVAIERNLDRMLDYSIPPGLVSCLKVGQRVKVPLGRRNRPVDGYVIEIRPDTCATAQIKAIYSIDDERVLLTPPLMQLACWMSRYYCCPLGTVLDGIIPSAVKRKIGLGYTSVLRLAQSRGQIQDLLEKTRSRKRRSILARLLQMKPEESADLLRFSSEAGATPATVRKLAKLGLITISAEPDYQMPVGNDEPAIVSVSTIELNEDQSRVFDDLRPRIDAGGFSVNLIHGVTGSGKTEIYLRCISRIVERGGRAIVLVPEIALTPQTVQRFTERFRHVAILHSGLAGAQRHHFWQRIAQGQADVVVGARSAIFAPVPNLGIIVVDEEHEGGYKQDSAPRYHARDVAIKRGQIENLPILLGSATPSLEMFCRASHVEAPQSKTDELYHLLSLPRRVRGLQLPHVELVDMRREIRMRPRQIHSLSKRLETLLRSTIDSGHQAILLLNRRGYCGYVHCPSCDYVVQCKYCDATMTYHRSVGIHGGSGVFEKGLHTGQLLCHYCLAANPLPGQCPDCGKKLSLFGLGTQRVEEELARKFPGLKFARVDSDSMHSARDYESTLGQFARGQIQVLLGTQMIAKGLDYPNVTLVGVISGDTALALPDFRAAERTFQLITQVAGRAGRGDAPGHVILQTFLPDDPTIRAAIQQDYLLFAGAELKCRREIGLPPIARMVRIIIRDQQLPKVQDRSERLALALRRAITAASAQVTIKGPMPCAINRIAGYHRFQVLLFSPSAAQLQRVLAAIRGQGGFSEGDRVAVDVDPISLL